MKIKILYLNLFPEIGGAETGLIYLLQKLDKELFIPIVIVPQKGLYSERLSKLDIKVHFLNLPGFFIRTLFFPGIDIFALLKFYKYCKKIKPDLIHLNHITQAFYAGVVSKIFGIPVVSTSWMNSDSIYFYQDIISKFGCTKILPITPKLKERIISKGIVDPDIVEVVPPGVDVNFFKPAVSKIKAKKIFNVDPKSITITIASRFDPVKDHITFLKAMNEVSKKYTNFVILIAQDTRVNLESSNNFAPSVKKNIDIYLDKHPLLKRRVKFIGYQENMILVYNATDILASSSLYEGLGMILVEAASCGIPTVSTDFDGQYVVVKDNETGFLVPIKNPKRMANKILLLLKNKSLRDRFGKKAREHIKKHLSIKRYSSKIEKIYINTINESK